jgi:nucleotide-binding universal stress UspA family protein
MFSKALMATSLSETSDAIVRCLKGLRKVGTREILLVHAMNIRDVGSLYDRLRELAAPRLEEQKRLLERMGYAVEVQVPLGFPYYEINRLAAERNASLIIVYSKAETVAGDYFLGGVAHDVLNRAEKPVLVLRARMIEQNGGTRCEVLCEDLFKHVLFPTDFSDGAERAFTYVEKIVESGCESVTLLHVQEKARISPHLEDRLEEFNRIDRSRLERLEDRLVRKGVRQVDIEVVYGSAAGEILKRAKANRFSLLVMGSQGRGFIQEVFLGSTSHQTVRHTPVPVLLIPSR